MSLPRSTPHAEGVDARGLADFLDTAERDDLGLHSLMVLRHGRVVAEGWWRPYAADRVHLAYSLSKTLTATAVGLLVDQGRLGLADPVVEHLPDVGRLSMAPGWEAVRIEHCLSMTVGHDTDAWPPIPGRGVTPGDDWLPRVLATTLDHEPGSHFAYNQVATYLLSLAVRTVTGGDVAAVLRDGLPDVLGTHEIPWHRDPLGRELGFSGAHLRTESIAALAQLYLDKGRWQDRSLLDEHWVEQATAAYGPLNRDPDAQPDWRHGYGYSFWGQQHGYRGDGAFGQFLVVLPEQDAVVAITSENPRMQATLDALWSHVLPAIGRAGSPADDAEVAERLRRAEIPPLRSTLLGAPSVRARVTSGDLPPEWDEVRVEGDRLALRRAGAWLEVAVGDGTWTESRLSVHGRTLPIAASGGWQDPTTYRAHLLVVETPHRIEVEVRRDGDAALGWRHVPLNGPEPFASAVRVA